MSVRIRQATSEEGLDRDDRYHTSNAATPDAMALFATNTSPLHIFASMIKSPRVTLKFILAHEWSTKRIVEIIFFNWLQYCILAFCIQDFLHDSISIPTLLGTTTFIFVMVNAIDVLINPGSRRGIIVWEKIMTIPFSIILVTYSILDSILSSMMPETSYYGREIFISLIVGFGFWMVSWKAWKNFTQRKFVFSIFHAMIPFIKLFVDLAVITGIFLVMFSMI